MLDEIIEAQQEAKWRSKITSTVALAIGAPITLKSNHSKDSTSTVSPNAPPKGYHPHFLQLSKDGVAVIAAALVEDTIGINGVPLNMVWDEISGRMRMHVLPDIKRKIMGWRNRFWALSVPSCNGPIMFTIAYTQASRWAHDDNGMSAHDASHDSIMVVPKHAKVTLTTLSIDNENTDNDWSTNDLRTQLRFLSYECAYHTKPRQMQAFLQAKAWWPAQL